MNIEQLEKAEKTVKNLIKYNRDNDNIRKFIERLVENEYLNIGTAHQYQLELSSKEAYELIGAELVELLKSKLAEREEYLEVLGANDLI